MQKKNFFIIIFYFLCLFGKSQSLILKDNKFTEKTLYAQTKQLGQFIKRFNNEENKLGIEYDKKDYNYRRNGFFREQYISNLFNLENIKIQQKLKYEFIIDVNNILNSKYLEFHADDWFAEAKTVFLYKGKEVKINLILELQEEIIGSKWVLRNVYFQNFDSLFFNKNISVNKKFIHPLSHELGFMNLRKFINDDAENVEYYSYKDYRPDFLSLFFYEIKKGNLSFKYVEKLKFHFLQIENWYFEVSYFNRMTFNSGWLISELKRVGIFEKNEFIKKICYEK